MLALQATLQDPSLILSFAKEADLKGCEFL